MKIRNYFFLSLFSIGFLVSCSSDDDNGGDFPEDPGFYSGGYFILNEGVFGSGNTTVSYVDVENGEVERDIYGPANNDASLGDVGQSMGFHGDYAFIVVNVSNKVEVVHRNTFERVASIEEGLSNPRYIDFIDDKAYVTNWGDGNNPEDDFIAVIDLNNFEVVDNIVTQEGPEEIVAHNGRLYVNLIGGWNFNDKLAVVDPTTKRIDEVEVGIMPNSVEIADGFVWVSAGGYPNYTEQESAGKISQIDLQTLEMVEAFDLPNATDHPYNLEVENGSVYYSLGKSIYTFEIGATQLPVEPVLELTEVAVFRSMEIYENLLWVTSATTDYTSNGKLLVYDLDTYSLIDSFDVGINPNGIYH